MTEKEILIQIAAALCKASFAWAMAKTFEDEGRTEKAEDYFSGSKMAEAEAYRLHAMLEEVRKGKVA